MKDLYDIPEYPNYQITKDGRVWTKNNNRFLKPIINKSVGYHYCRLNKNGKTKFKYIHRLLAEIFIPNPQNHPEVDHIDRNRTNNNLENLQWVSRNQNQINRKTRNKSGYRHIYIYPQNPIYTLKIVRNKKLIFIENFNIYKYTIQDIVKYRNEIVYPQFNIEIDD